MLINSDAKSLEWVVAAYLSQDKLAIEEIISGFDMHSNNQKVLGLPTRLIAKTFVFRLIYGGGAYAYSIDQDFAICKYSRKQWQESIEKFYARYTGLAAWHKSIYTTVIQTGKLVMPTGREYVFNVYEKNGDVSYSRPQILNYPVQGMGADIIMLARISMYNRMRALNLTGTLISTVHDSIVIDAPEHETLQICELFDQVYRDLPINFERMFGVKFNVPLRCETMYGQNLKEMKLYEP